MVYLFNVCNILVLLLVVVGVVVLNMLLYCVMSECEIGLYIIKIMWIFFGLMGEWYNFFLLNL